MIRVGVVGLGKMGILHTAILSSIPGCEIVGLVDADPSVRRLVTSLGLRAPFYTSLAPFIEQQAPTALFACVPPIANLPIARICVERGIHVFIEKPLANSLENARGLVDLLRNRPSLRHAVGFMTAHYPCVRKAREIVAAGVLGGVRDIQASIVQGSVLATQRGWICQQEIAGGGALTSIGSHLLFLLYWFFGPVAQVSSVLMYKRNAVEDEGEVTLVSENGITEHLHVAWDVPGVPTLTLRMAIRGTNGVLAVTNRELKLQLKDASATYPAGTTRIHASDLPDPAAHYLGGQGYYAQDLEFLSCIATGQEPTATWWEGNYVQAMLDAIYRAAEERRAVHVACNGFRRA